MTSIPAEFYALVNAFLFALHNMFTKKALRYSNPATAVISGLLINIIFLWGLSILFVPMASLTRASILIFAVVGLFQPGLTRLLSYKGIDALGVAITDPIRATTPLFSAHDGDHFSRRETHAGDRGRYFDDYGGYYAVVVAQWFDETCRVGGLSVVPDRSVGTGGRYSSRSQGRSSGGSHPLVAAAVTATSSFIVSILTLWYVERNQQTWKMNRQCFWWFLAAGLTISVAMVCIYYALDLEQGFGRDPDRQHRPVLLINLGRDVFARRRARHGKDRSQRRHDRGRGGAAHALEVIRAKTSRAVSGFSVRSNRADLWNSIRLGI